MTRITLEEPKAAGYPVVKRTALGQTFNGAVLQAESRDRLKRSDDGTMVPIVKPNGKHSQELVVTCLTMPGTTAPAGLGDTESVPEPGDIVRLILKGKAFGDWIEAKRTLPNGILGVGDVVTQTTTVAQVYDAQGNASGPEVTDQKAVDQAKLKGRSVGIYGPLTLAVNTDDVWQEKAVSVYRSMQERIPVEDEPGLGGSGTASATVTPSNGESLPKGMTPEVWAGLSDDVKAALKEAAAPA